jgi:hypothetical protein
MARKKDAGGVRLGEASSRSLKWWVEARGAVPATVEGTERQSNFFRLETPTGKTREGRPS